MRYTRRALCGAVAGLLCLSTPLLARDAPEISELTIGLPVTSSTFLPLYLAEEEGFFADEGVAVKIVAFRGGTDLVRGMIADAVEIGVTSLAGVNVGIAAGQPIKAFYGGFNMAIFDWYSTPDITALADARGKRFGVSTLGSSTDFLTRYALLREDIDPETDVQIIQGGGSPARLAAMDAGQLDVNIFATPEKFMAADKGYNLLLRQSDLAPDYPFHVFFATEEFLAQNPRTIEAVLRGFARGVRLAKEDRERSIRLLVERVGMSPEYSERGYDDFIDNIFENGRMPSAEGMASFFDVGILSGEYTEAWPEERYLDRTFIDSYEVWRPE